jgi:phosphoglycerate dehydrogenase-like enzyme
MKNITVSSPSFSKNKILVEELYKSFPDSVIKINSGGEHLKGNSLIDFLKDSDAIIIGTEKFNIDIIKNLPNLKTVSKYGVGVDNVDIQFLKERNISFRWKGGVNRRSVSEMTLGFMLSLARNLFYTNSLIKSGNWLKNGGYQLSGKKIGIIGCGFIGEDLIRLLQPFHCEIQIYDLLDKSYLESCYNVRQVNLDTLINESDIITIHTPLTNLTKNLVNNSFLSKMKKNSYLINTARGGIVVEDDLKEYLQKFLNGDQSYTICGSALDVFTTEPNEDSELLNLKNLYCTPHIGGNANEAVLSMGRSAINGLSDDSMEYVL